MSRRTGETIIPLLPPPEETGASLSAEIPGQQQILENVLAKATLAYIKNINRTGQDKIPLSPAGTRIAAAVIADAIKLGNRDMPISLMSPKDLKLAIKDGLSRRNEERQQGISVLHQLGAPSGPRGGLTGHDLAIPKTLINYGQLEAYKYPTVPKPESLRRLIALTDERIKVVPETAKESLVEALGLPHQRGNPYDVNRYLQLPEMETSAVVNRGEVAARIISPRSGNYDRRRPLGVDDLKLLAKILSGPEADKEISAVAAAAATELMRHQPELVQPAKDALKDFGGQMRRTARYWKGTAPEGTAAGVREAVTLAEIFAGVPIVPLASQISWITRIEDIASGKAGLGGKRHLWENPQILEVGGEKKAFPNETILVDAFIQLRSLGAGSDTLRRINEARRSWANYERVVTKNPPRINEEKMRLGSLFPQFAGLIGLEPDEYPVSGKEVANRLKKSGGAITGQELKVIIEAIDKQESNLGIARAVSATGRRIKFYQKCLGDYEKWEQIIMSLDDANEVGDKQLVDQILTERSIELEEEIRKLTPRLSRSQALLEKLNIGTALYYWQTQPDQPQEHWQGAAIPQSIEDTDRQVDLVEHWVRKIENGEATLLSIGLPLDAVDDPRLIGYLRIRQEILSTNSAPSKAEMRRLTLAARTIETGLANRPVFNPLKTLIAQELKQRYQRLINYRRVVEKLQEKETEINTIKEAKANFMSGEDKNAAAALAGIESPAKRKGIKALARLKLVHRNVRNNPDEYRSQLETAGELVGLHRRTKTFTFELPINSSKIPGEIKFQRNRDLATGRRTVEWSDQSGPASLPKGATAANIQRMLEILQLSFDEPNVFIPLKQAAGLSMGELMKAVSARMNVVLAQQELPELIKESQRFAAQLDTIHREKEQAESLAKAKVIAKRIRGLEDELLNAPKRLVAEMERQKLVLEL